jgi:hypothetical protein
MLKALKVILIVFGAISVVMGVIQAFFPAVISAMMNLGEMPDVCSPGLYALASLGVALIAGGIFFIIAGTRDIIRNILWVQFALLWTILSVAIAAFSALMGYVTFEQTMGGIITDGVFFILLMAFYPYRAVRSGARRRK